MDQAPGAWREGLTGPQYRQHPLMLARDLQYVIAGRLLGGQLSPVVEHVVTGSLQSDDLPDHPELALGCHITAGAPACNARTGPPAGGLAGAVFEVTDRRPTLKAWRCASQAKTVARNR
ncbi:hypothetical protein [Streptacidiphilus rugosus]|uniref:hypothetical protein n=1 Tax=Streptacidiphilus rugosus TaxID=405783 RepID=UPI0012F9324B|nr:hypothetical protein [Streptacidiphilus rugosus]